MMASSAFTASEKMSILVHEGNRKLRNSRAYLEWSEKWNDVNTSMMQMTEGVKEKELVDQGYIGESHISVVTRYGSHFDLYKPERFGCGGAAGGVRREVQGGGWSRRGG